MPGSQKQRVQVLAQQILAAPTKAAVPAPAAGASSISTTALNSFHRGSGFSVDFKATKVDYDWAEYTAEQVAGHLRHLRENGYTILENAIEPEVLKNAHQACIDLYQTEGVGKSGARYIEKNEVARGESAQFQHTDLLGKDRRFWALTAQQNLLRVLRGVLGEDMLIATAITRWTRPGCSEQGFHTDDLNWGRKLFPRPRPVDAQVSCNALIATSDFTAGNGATKLFPRTHLIEELPYGLADGKYLTHGGEMDAEGFHPLVNLKSEEWIKANKPECAPIRAEMKAGSVLVWYGSTWHGGGAYTDLQGADRGGIIYNFCDGTLRPNENTFLMHSTDLVAQMPVDVQRVLGYAEGGPYSNLGYVNSSMPARLLGAGGNELRKWQLEHAPPDTFTEKYNPTITPNERTAPTKK